MNIIHVYRSMGQGGAQKVILQLCKSQVSDNNRVWVISSGGFYEEDLREMGVTHIRIPDISSKNPKNIISCYRIIKNICRELKEGVIHTHHRSAAFLAQIACRSLEKIHLIYTSHNVFTGKKLLLRYALKNTTVIAVGSDVEKNLTDYYGIPKQQIVIIRNSVEKEEDNESCTLFERIPGHINVAFIGRLTKVKGVDVLLQAYKLAEKANPDVELHIIGDGDKSEEYKNLSQELRLKSVRFYGYRKDAKQLIRQFDFLVLPSWQEGFPLTIIEAFAYGRTVIASDIPGNSEIIKDGNNGLLFTPGNYTELAEKITLLCKDSALLNHLCIKALDDYEKNYSYKTFIEKYKKAYKTQ